LASGLHLEGIDDEAEEEEEEEAPPGHSSSSSGRINRGQQVDDTTQAVSTQDSEQSEDLFQEFDLRKARSRFG
jgi:hypothetical protein